MTEVSPAIPPRRGFRTETGPLMRRIIDTVDSSFDQWIRTRVDAVVTYRLAVGSCPVCVRHYCMCARRDSE